MFLPLSKSVCANVFVRSTGNEFFMPPKFLDFYNRFTISTTSELKLN